MYGLVMIAFFPSVRDAAVDFEELIDAYPPALMEAFGLSPDADFTNYAVFLGVEYLNVIWAVIAAVYLIMAGTAVIAQEIENGTAELWLTLPARRTQLLFPKVISLYAGAALLTLVTMFSIGAGAVVVDNKGTVGPEGVLALGVVLFAFSVCVGGYSVLLSTIFRQRGRAAGIAAAITLGSYLFGVIGNLSDSWNWLKYISIFTAYKPEDALASNSIQAPETGVLFLIGIITCAAAFIIFPRRDIVL